MTITLSDSNTGVFSADLVMENLSHQAFGHIWCFNHGGKCGFGRYWISSFSKYDVDATAAVVVTDADGDTVSDSYLDQQSCK